MKQKHPQKPAKRPQDGCEELIMNTIFTYPGVALHQDLDQGKAPGQITLDGRSIRFEFEGQEIEFPLHTIIIKHGGSSNQLIFLEHPDHPGWQIYTGKKSILKDLKRLASPQLSQQVGKIHSTWMKLRMISLAVLIVIGLLIFGLFQLRGPLTKTVARSIPAEWESTLGKTVFSEYRSGKIVLDDPELRASLENLTSELMKNIPENRYEFTIFLIKDDTVNAFALPGGYVVLNTGFIQTAESAEEILGVLAHEISHVTLQHGIRKQIDEVGFLILLNAVLGDLGGLWAKIAEGSVFLLNQKFSRGFEKEADIRGFNYLIDSKIDPSGMVSFFRRLHETGNEEGELDLDGTLSFLSTHPASEERMNYLQKKIDKITVNIDYFEYTTELKQLKEALKKARENL